jgi:SAM-dependent methyltransferase
MATGTCVWKIGSTKIGNTRVRTPGQQLDAQPADCSWPRRGHSPGPHRWTDADTSRQARADADSVSPCDQDRNARVPHGGSRRRTRVSSPAQVRGAQEGNAFMVRWTDGAGPGTFDEEQAQAYAAAMDIETEFLHDRVVLEMLWRHARGVALDLGGGTGRYAAWLLNMGLVTSAHMLDNSPPMIEACLRRGAPGLSAQACDIETADLGREHYDIAIARFVLMHVRELKGTLEHIAKSLKDKGTLVIVTNIIDGTPTAIERYIGDTAGIMKLIIQVQGRSIRVSNYARTQKDYTTAVQQAGLGIEFCEKYEPKILRFEQDPPGITLSHLVLVGRK